LAVDQTTFYERIGGRAGVRLLANRFYDIMQTERYSQSILAMHPKDLTRSRKQLERYLCELMGGPKLFGEAYMSPEWIKQRHKHLEIGFAERDQWVMCMSQAVQELEIDKGIKHELNTLFYQVAGYIRNRN